MISSKTLYVVVAVSILLLIAYTVTQRKEDAPTVGTPMTSAAKNFGVTTGPTAQAEPDANPKRSFFADRSSMPILTDVPESQLDYQILENFLGARHMAAYRIVSIDTDALRTIIRQSAVVPDFDIQLFDSDPITLTTLSAIEHSSGWQNGFGTWTGFTGSEKAGRSSFQIAPDATVDGTFFTLQYGLIRIEAIPGTTHHIVWRWDPEYTKKID